MLLVANENCFFGKLLIVNKQIITDALVLLRLTIVIIHFHWPK